MPTEEEVLGKLNQVLVPGVTRSLVQMNLVQRIQIENHKVDITLS